MKRKAEEEEIHLPVLPNDVILNIIFRLPTLDVRRLCCLSKLFKKWIESRLITVLQDQNSTYSGVFLTNEDKNNVIWYDNIDGTKAPEMLSSKKLWLEATDDQKHNYFMHKLLIGCNHGILIYETFDKMQDGDLFLMNPYKSSSFLICIPHFMSNRCSSQPFISHKNRAVVVFADNCTEYKLFYFRYVNSYLERHLHVYSSKDKKWTSKLYALKHRPLRCQRPILIGRTIYILSSVDPAIIAIDTEELNVKRLSLPESLTIHIDQLCCSLYNEVEMTEWRDDMKSVGTTSTLAPSLAVVVLLELYSAAPVFKIWVVDDLGKWTWREICIYGQLPRIMRPKDKSMLLTVTVLDGEKLVFIVEDRMSVYSIKRHRQVKQSKISGSSHPLGHNHFWYIYAYTPTLLPVCAPDFDSSN